MSQFYIQVPDTDIDGEEVIEFFDSLDDIEDYASDLLKYCLPEEEGFLIYQGTQYVSCAVRMPCGQVMVFRE